MQHVQCTFYMYNVHCTMYNVQCTCKMYMLWDSCIDTRGVTPWTVAEQLEDSVHPQPLLYLLRGVGVTNLVKLTKVDWSTLG